MQVHYDRSIFGFPLPEMMFFRSEGKRGFLPIKSCSSWAYAQPRPMSEDQVGMEPSLEECRPEPSLQTPRISSLIPLALSDSSVPGATPTTPTHPPTHLVLLHSPMPEVAQVTRMRSLTPPALSPSGMPETTPMTQERPLTPPASLPPGICGATPTAQRHSPTPPTSPSFMVRATACDDQMLPHEDADAENVDQLSISGKSPIVGLSVDDGIVEDHGVNEEKLDWGDGLEDEILAVRRRDFLLPTPCNYQGGSATLLPYIQEDSMVVDTPPDAALPHLEGSCSSCETFKDQCIMDEAVSAGADDVGCIAGGADETDVVSRSVEVEVEPFSVLGLFFT